LKSLRAELRRAEKALEQERGTILVDRGRQWSASFGTRTSEA
jgi:hypothetical protein